MALCVTFNQFEQRNIQRYFIDGDDDDDDDNSTGMRVCVYRQWNENGR